MEPKNHIYSKISSNTDEHSDARHLVELCDPRLRFAVRNNRTIGFKQVAYPHQMFHSIVIDS